MRRLLTLLLLFGTVFVPGIAAAQSFNCNRASFPDERRICADPALSDLDERLAAVYDEAVRKLNRSGQQQLEYEEEAWVIERRRCGSNYRCIESSYLERIAELAAIAGALGYGARTARRPVPETETRASKAERPVDDAPRSPPKAERRVTAAERPSTTRTSEPQPSAPRSGSTAPRTPPPAWIDPAPSQ